MITAMNDSPYTDQEMDGLNRARGDYFWMNGELSITLIENTLDLADLEPVACGVQPEYVEVVIRRRVAGPMASPITPEAALLVAFVIATHGFLQELGKDAYTGFRSALYAVYTKAKTWANGRGYSPMIIKRSDFEHVYFHLLPGMSAETFLAAFLAFCNFSDPEVAEQATHSTVIMEFEVKSQTWQVSLVLEGVLV